MKISSDPMATPSPRYLRRWLGAATMGLALAAPAHSSDDASGYAYQLHRARPAVEQLGQDVSQYEPIGGPRYVVQGPNATLGWVDRIPAAERTPANANYARYRKTMGLLVPHYWADGRSASQDSGWRERNYAIHYDSFSSSFERGDDDRRIAGHSAKHYVFTAQHVSWAEGDPRKEHNEVSYDLWVLSDVAFSWATVLAAGPDVRVSVAMAEHLVDRGLVARIDKKRTRFIARQDGEASPEQHSAEAVWISDLEPATPPTIELPVVEAATMDTLQAHFRSDTEAICKTLLSGDTPAFITELLNTDAQAAFVSAIRPGCESRYGS